MGEGGALSIPGPDASDQFKSSERELKAAETGRFPWEESPVAARRDYVTGYMAARWLDWTGIQ
jgi:hypothetical protein